MSALPPEVMAQLQTEYISGFREKIHDIESKFDGHDWAALREIFHKSAGSGATYRMPEISDIALHMEFYLKAQKEPDANLVHQGVDLFRRVLEGRIAGQPLNLEGNAVIAKLAPYRKI